MFFFSGPSCRHIKKGTDQTLLKKLSGNSKWTSCQDCKDEENKENNCMEQDCEEEQETPAIWMCLKCGHSVSFLKYFIHLCTKVSKGADLFWTRVVAEILTTSMPSNTMKLHIQIRTVWWSVWTTGVCGECMSCVYYPLTLGTLSIRNAYLYILSFFATHPGVTYVMMKFTTLEQDIWLSLLITSKNKPLYILQTLHGKVGPIVLFCMFCFWQIKIQVML